MLHDVFIRRYPDQLIGSGSLPPRIGPLFMQVAHIVYDDLAPALALGEHFFKSVHGALARELGVGRLAEANSCNEICGRFLVEPYNQWNDRHGPADYFLKARLSLIELLFREAERQCEPPESFETAVPGLSQLLSPWRRKPGTDRTPARAAYEAAVRELNSRFRQAELPLHYHNGMFQFSHDELTEERVAEPCWSALSDAKWANVDLELKEAIDSADTGKADAVFHAAKALESTIKVISDEKGWTHGGEAGASSYIDNLVSQKNGRFIDVWEAEFLRLFFKHVRNPQGHGAGSQRPSALTPNQTEWAIETVMAWIKNLARRA